MVLRDIDGLDVGIRVKTTRISLGLSLRAFAKQAGVGHSALKRLEDGHTVSSKGMLRILAAAGIGLTQCKHEWETRCLGCGAVGEGG